MKLTGSVVIFVLLLASALLAVTPMTPDQQTQALRLRIDQFSARYLALHDDILACGAGEPEPNALWQQTDATMNAWLIQNCGSVDNYDIGSNQCKSGNQMTPSQQYQTLQYRVSQFVARYAELDHAAIMACGGQQNLPPNPPSWAQSDTAMNAFLLQMCGGYQNYSTSQNQCK